MSHGEEDRQLTRIRASVADRLKRQPGSPLISIAEGTDAVAVHLQASAVSIAEELYREFGNGVDLKVGFKSFPDGTLLRPAPVLEERGSLPSIYVECALEADFMRGGDELRGEVVIHNSGASHVDIYGAAGGSWLCRSGTLQVVGGYTGWMAPVLQMLSIGPRASETMSFRLGTASCEPGPGYVVSIGRYEVVAPIELRMKSGEDTASLLARDCFIEVI